MDEARFAILLDAYGGDPRRWPGQERAQAEAFVKAFPERAAPLLEEALKLDAALDAFAPPPPPTALLRARILRAAREVVKPFNMRMALAAMAASLAIGVLIGAQGVEGAARADAADAAIAALDADDPWAELEG
jgi:hypothetical protein